MLISKRKLLMRIIFIAFSVFHASRAAKPVIIKPPNNQDVYLNQSTTFVCKVQSTNQLMIQWKKDNGQILQNVRGFLLIFSNGNLTFLHARRSDIGIYTCIAKNAEGTSSAQATLRVLEPPVKPKIIDISANQTIHEGMRVTFSCKATGQPSPQITWKRFLKSGDDKYNTPQLELPSPQSIRISSVSPRDAGKYLCIAENESGNDTRAVYLNVLGYPVFIISPPPNMTVDENTTVKLDCKVIGSPILDVIWYYGNKLVKEISNIIVLPNNTIEISDVKFENSGSYCCVAKNSAGLQRSRKTSLYVRSKPRLVCCPNMSKAWQNQTAIDGKSSSLKCLVAGYPNLQYQWIFENRTVSYSPVIDFSNVSKSNEGVYSCMANNNLGEVILIIHLYVLVPPHVSVHPKQVTVVEGEHVHFLCSATGVPLPTVTWYSSGEVLLQNNTFIISNVSKSDAGEYFCEAKNEAGEKIIKATVVVAVQPTFYISPRNYSAIETSSLNIQCAAKGPDQPIINWYRLTENGWKVKLNVSCNELTITHVERDDSGYYVCEARNAAGYINTTFFINVQYPPYVLTSEQNVSIVSGEQAVLYCPVKSNPAPKVQWITPVSLQEPGLTITKVNVSDGGLYYCRGKNFLGRTETFLQVQVLTPPRIVDLKLVELLNGFVSISCVTIGKPESNIDWINETPLHSGSFNVHNGNLLIEKRQISSMKFLCNASNIYGWMTKLVAVPSSPSNFTITKLSSTSVKFLWFKKESEVISNFIVERRSLLDLKWVPVDSSVITSWFEDKNLSPFTSFAYRVRAQNQLGTSNPGSFNITTKEGVPSPPSRLTAKLVSLSSIAAYWEAPREPRGQQTNIIYEICYKESMALSHVKIAVNNTKNEVQNVKIQSLKSNTAYLIKIRAGRLIDGSLHWSNYVRTSARTLQKAPTTAPKEVKAYGSGPRRIFVTWQLSHTYVEGYKLQYTEYESTNYSIIVIKSWNTSSYMIKELRASQYYEVKLKIFTTGGDGPWSLPLVVRTETDRIGLPGPISNPSDSLPWKIAVGGAALAVILLLLLLAYIYLMRKSNREKSDGTKRRKKTSQQQGGYDFTDNMSGVSNESEGSFEGVYNVNLENDHIDLSMFDNSHHTAEHMYVENPILPTPQDESDDSYEAVRLATFIARPSPHPTPQLTGRRQLSESHVNPVYIPDEYDVDSKADRETAIKDELPDPGDSNIPIYSQVDFAKKERDRRQLSDSKALERLSDDILI